MKVLEGLEDYIRCKIEMEQLVDARSTQSALAGELPWPKGIRKQQKVTGEELDAAVSDAVSKVGYAMYADAPEHVYILIASTLNT